MRARIMRNLLLAMLIVVVTASFLGCATPPPSDTPRPTTGADEPPVADTTRPETVQSGKSREVSPDIPEDDISELVSGANSFAFDLYQQLRGEEGNFFYSPYSISAALAMTYAGARGETERQMADTLHYTLGQDRLHPAFNWLDQALTSRGKDAGGRDDQGFRLNVVNAIWGQKDYEFRPNFLDTLAANYGAGLRVLDFTKDVQGARQAINSWVSDQTEGRIKDLIPDGVLDATTRLVLTNAIYFNAAWQFPFDEQATADGPFHRLDGSQVTVPMMHVSESFAYTENDTYQAIELPYDGGELSMIILLPREGQFEQVEAALDAELTQTALQDMIHQQVNLAMPRFEFDADLSLAQTLAAMGMPIAFTGDADFSGMAEKGDLFISNVLHKAFVSVDEAGTEAAAATAVVMKELSVAPGEPIEMTIDRPFVFLIRDVETGSILFLGRVVDPS